MANDTFDKLLTSTPLNSTAGRVTSKGEAAWVPRKPVPQGHLHWENCPRLKQFADMPSVHDTLTDLAGKKFGRFTVVGILDDENKTNRGLRWVVKCVCGDYEARNGAAIKLALMTPNQEKHSGYQCWNCNQLGSIQRQYKKKGSKPLSHFTAPHAPRSAEKIKNPVLVIADEIFTNGDQWDMDDGGIAAATKIIARLNSAGYRVVRDSATESNQAAVI